MATDDSALISRCVDGDTLSLNFLITKYRSDIYRFIRSKVFDDTLCDDIFQDTVIKIVDALKSGKYTDNKKFISWAMRIAHNLIIDNLRGAKKLKKHVPVDIESDVFLRIKDDCPTIDSTLAGIENINNIKSLIRKLPKEQRNMVEMRYYEELSFKKIAERENISINTATARMRYAIINLRSSIGKNTNAFY